MEDKGTITILSRGLPLNGTEVNELENLCLENGIKFENKVFRMDGIQAYDLQAWVTILFSDETIQFLLSVFGQIAATLISAKILNVIEKHRKKDGQSKRTDSIELQSSSAKLKIETEHLSDDQFQKAYATFLQVSKENKNKDGRPAIPVFVVIENGDAKVMSQNDYIWKYVVPKKDDAEGKDDGQA